MTVWLNLFANRPINMDLWQIWLYKRSMSREITTLPASADPLGETLHLLRLTGTLYCRSELTAPWGVDLPPLEGCMMLHVITVGGCWLEVRQDEPRWLPQGSVALVPHGVGHVLRSDSDAPSAPLFDIPVEQVSERYEVMRHGGGGDFTHAICVVVRFDHVAAEQLVALLPNVIQLNPWKDDGSAWLQDSLRFISREAAELRPGGETVITRLADILVIQMIRAWIDTAPEGQQGWLAALRDPQIGRALAAIHRTPEHAWSVAELAQDVGMSRSAFSARFTQLVGDSVMRYLTRWRLQLARTYLRETSDPLARIAERIGYESQAAFCRAFKRMFAAPPGSVRNRSKTAP
jgi:AraC-like DNA-binding protein